MMNIYYAWKVIDTLKGTCLVGKRLFQIDDHTVFWQAAKLKDLFLKQACPDRISLSLVLWFYALLEATKEVHLILLILI